MDELAEFYVHTVTAEAFDGIGSYGPTYKDPVPVACFVDETTKLVRNSEGDEVVSSTTITAPVAAGPSLVAQSRVTLPSGRISTVITCAVHTSGDLGLPDHTEAALE